MRSLIEPHELSRILDAFHTDLLMGSYVGDNDRLGSIRLQNGFLSSPLSELVAFFFLNDSVFEKVLENVFSKEALRDLEPFVRRSGTTIRLEQHRLAFQGGCYFLCHTKEENGFAYHGADSLALGRITQRCSGRILDVCTGVGVQGISLARRGATVECLDINGDCEELFWFNAALNGVTDRVSFQVGTIEDVDSERFDCVVCNPPLLPVPLGIRFPPVGHGGADGLQVLLPVLRRCNELLRPAGQVRFVCTVPGSSDGPDLSSLAAAAKQGRLSLDLIVPCRAPLEPGQDMFEGLTRTAILAGSDATEARRAYSKHFLGMGASHLYSILGAAVRSSGKEATQRMRVSQHFGLNRSFWAL
ncbi:methyltransferase [Xanthobacter versatilis]|uniref:methyltransferase n=1 Tax=Xanthobacter autotrophicus (strain ATCC BAA-1158 / Py2) TaxID=78245 RepID=UPI00372BAD22